MLLEEGVDVKTVSERLGHDSIQTTLEIYGHVTPKMRGNAAARFGSLLARAGLEHMQIAAADEQVSRSPAASTSSRESQL
ncbi:MAG TPA: hypothetical protein VK256_01050 [Candidatus Eisenbacteria bacterium]|nr:hypothetical protein [Candidatus Eisenbacteria bacterium]